MVRVFSEVRRVLRDDGTLWLNLGDSYASYRDSKCSVGSGIKHKDLVGIPWRVAFALQADGWYLRSDIIWSKPNPMPESVTDRPTKAHEYVFLMSKAARYWYDAEAVALATSYPVPENRSPSGDYSIGSGRNDGGEHRSGGFVTSTTRNRRTVWHIATQPYPEAHFATYPEKLVEPCVLAGCPEGGTVLDPFTGSGTTGAVACRLGRNFVGIELNHEYAAMAERRIAPHRDQLQLAVTP